MFEQVAKLLADYKEMDVAQIQLETSFEELSLDSLDTVELLIRVEDELGVSLEMTTKLKTVGDLVTAVEEKKAASHA